MPKPSGEKQKSGFDDVIGLVLLLLAVLLLAAQLSFDRYDIAGVRIPPSTEIHNWIGHGGAYLGWFSFVAFGGAAYLLPPIFALFGFACLFGKPVVWRERPRWMALWAFLFLLCSAGVLHILDRFNLAGYTREHLYTNSAGGVLGYGLFRYAFQWLGTVGALIVFICLDLISLLFITNFQLSHWLRALAQRPERDEAEVEAKAKRDTATDPTEASLQKRARELEKQKRQLEEEMARTGEPDSAAPAANLGADMKPVPEPTVRDLSYPQPAKGPRLRKTTLPETATNASTPSNATPAEPAEPVEVIPADEIIAAATTEQILGRKSAAKSAAAETPEPTKTDDVTEVLPDAETALPVAAVVPAAAAKPKVVTPRKPKPVTVASVPQIGNYQLPSLDFLQLPDLTVKPTESKEELMANARLMQQTLAQFDIEVSLGDITKGPTITRYELHPAPGVKLEKIQNLSNNLAAALKAERIHILAPVPGKSSVGVEVPNAVKTKVIMRDLFDSEEWRNTKARIPIALGKDVYGHPIIADLAEMPHLLIAGSTGSGKSVCVNSIIASLLYRFSPDQLRFVMIDPKVVELQQYNALPHLVVPVVTDPKKVILALRWVVNEMEKRYQIFARVGVRNIKAFNERPNKKIVPQEPELPLMARKEKVEAGAEGFAVEVDEQIVVPRDEDIIIPEKLSYIVVIIDELADLMLVAPADVEMAIARITQMARAAGIHCIVATQRPSVDVITGVIKANIPARIAFQVASRVDSRTILDAMGADKLLGKGDMLYLPPGSAKLHRAQGALITDQELQAIVDFIALQGKPSYEMEIHQQLSKPGAAAGDPDGPLEEDEEIVQQCIEVIRSEQKASVSLLQRRLRLGYTRAARIMDELENRGIVGPSKGAEPRDILLDLDGEGHDGAGQSGV